jgi:phage terminase large subunit
MGLDDPQKVKSIKLPFGYIGVTWFEELDQYAGENELRNVMQSTMRGGNKFWDFRTFNPPISKNNWANEYTDDCETFRQSDTLVVRNTYLDVPEEWLGEQFIEEANFLKEINERAYIHEYLGQAIGTGGDVFPNVEDLDMTQPVQYRDASGTVIREVPMLETFDHIYHGMDVGFAMDPTRYVKCHFDRQRLNLYIFDEFSTKKNRSADIYEQLYNQRKLIENKDQLICDPGGGGLFVIADFRAFGAYAREADKGPGSVDYGIKWLQGLAHIYIDKRRCPDTFKEFVEYEYEQDKDGNFISAYPDENNHSIDAVRYALQKYANRKGN